MKVNVQPESMSPLKKEFIKIIEKIPNDKFDEIFASIAITHLAKVMATPLEKMFDKIIEKSDEINKKNSDLD